MSKFSIFEPATKDSIRVGYIDPDRGYIRQQSIYEANVHASKNPGAIFILETRDRIRYLTINEVNNLKVKDITPDKTSCEDGIKGLRPGETPAYPSGKQEIVVSGTKDGGTSKRGARIPKRRRVKAGASGGTPLTVGGNGGRPVTAGGKYLKSGGKKVKSGGTGGEQIFLGGTGGTPVLLDKQPLTINGKGVFAGGEGGIPITSGGVGGQRLSTDGSPNNECESKIFISGGGGVGAFAVPVIGTDGSVLTVIVTEGGFGYKTPPQSRLFDSCRRGVGTVLKTILGETKPTTITYDQEDDFEVYDLTPPFTLSGYGKRFGPDGEELGDWDPNLFASLQEDPIARQIRDYQEILKQYTKPWWHTRKETPLEVIFRDKSNRIKHDVQHVAWGGETETSKDLVSVEFEVYGQGSRGNRSIVYEFAAKDGSHNFRIKGVTHPERSGKTRVDIVKVKANTTYDVKAKVISGRNARSEKVEQGLLEKAGRDARENRQFQEEQRSSTIFGDIIGSLNDNDDIQITSKRGKFKASNRRIESVDVPDDLKEKFKDQPNRFKRATFDLTYRVNVPGATNRSREIKPSFMNNYAISPVPPSNVPGSDYAGRVATFVWEEDFPTTGNYKFRGMADNIGKIYIDNELILEERRFKGDPVKPVSKYIEEGVHEIKVELFNIPILEKPKTKTPKLVPVEFEVYGQGSKSNMQISFVFDGAGHSFTIPNVNKSNSTSKKTINVKPNVDYKVTSIMTGDKTHTSKTVDGKKEFDIVWNINKVNIVGRNDIRGIQDNKKEIKLRDEHGDDTNATFKIKSTSPGVDARFSDDGQKLIVKGDMSGDITLELKWDDNPRTAGVALKSIKILGETWSQIGEKGSQTKTINLGKPKKEIEKSARELEQGLSKIFGRAKKGTERGEGEGQIIFADYIGSANDNDDMQIKCNSGSFTSSNKRPQTGTGPKGTQKRSTYDLSFRVNAKASESSKGDSNQTQKYESIFNTADYVNKADRKLWRTNVYGRSGFLSENGICPFNTKKPLEDNPYAGTHVIRWEGVNFPDDGNYEITVDADDSVKIFIGNRDGKGKMQIGNGLKDVEVGGDEVIIENGMKKQTYTRFFKKGKYRIRTELKQIPGGRFSFDENGKAGGSDVTARFIERDGQRFMKVEGSGSAEIHFRLRTDDNPRISGSFAERIKIGSGVKDVVELKRSYDGKFLKEKEVIKGSAFFEAGREYRVKALSSVRNDDVGARIKNKGQTIEYDDNISNGFDENADLTITKITNQQKPKVKGINPMALAIDIKVKSVEEQRISARSWQQNPMGAAFTIDAPFPEIPQEPPLEQKGRCPNNPLWSSRFKGGSESWWPVTHPAWSKFTNRFAMSPLPPLSLPNSDGGGGVVYSNTWQVDFPYDGFYGFKGTGDNKGRILLDGEEVYKLKGFKNQSPEIVKRKITEGNHEVTLEIENQDQRKRKKVTKEIFNTQKWQAPIKVGPPNPAELTVEYRGLNQGITKQVSSGSGDKVYPITYEDLNPSNIPASGRGSISSRRIRVENNGKRIELKDGLGDDANVTFEIRSTSPGVSAKFSDDGRELKVKGNGNVTIRLKYDDNPSHAGEAVRSITIAGKKWRKESKHKGEETHTINVGTKDSKEVIGKGGFTVSGNDVKMRDGHGDDINSTFSIVSSTVDAKFSSDGKKINYKGSGEITLRLKWDDNPKKYGVAVDSIAVGGKVWDQKGEKGSKTQTIKVTAESDTKGGIKSGKKIDEVTYTGPELFNFKHPAWSKLMNKSSVSPYTPPLNEDNPDINGTFILKWSGVKFPENGRYDIKFQADNIAKLFIDGTEVQEVRSFRGEPTPRYVELSRGKYDVEIQLTNVRSGKDIFNSNPSGVALKISKDITIVSSESPPWTSNPVGASAMIIPPPCPKVIEGTGFVKEIVVIEPGNGHPPPEFPENEGKGIPVTLQLVDIVPTAPGIGYTPGDKVIVDVPDRPPIEFTPELDPFGRITGIDIPRFPTTSTGSGDGPPPPPDPTSSGGGGEGVIPNSETQILQVKDLPGEIGVDDDTGVLIPLIPSGGGEGGGGTPVPVPGPFYGFTEYPNIYPTSNTGLGFRARPVFEAVIVPENILPNEAILQVVDIPGLRKTGYVNGKPYYGQVFAKDGNLYAGISETIGELVPVYATLQESILNRQVVEPSAILRTGTETNSNDPTLDIPNTPDNLI